MLATSLGILVGSMPRPRVDQVKGVNRVDT